MLGPLKILFLSTENASVGGLHERLQSLETPANRGKLEWTHQVFPKMDDHPAEEALVHALENYHAVVVADKAVLAKLKELSGHLHALELARVVPDEALPDHVMHRLILQQATSAQVDMRNSRRRKT